MTTETSPIDIVCVSSATILTCPPNDHYTHAPVDLSKPFSSVRINVTGYWSEVITLHICRGTRWYRPTQTEGEAPYAIDMSHSSGGRDTKVIKDDLEAETHFAHAILGAVELGRTIMQHTSEMEAAWQAQHDRYVKVEEDRAAAKKARLDADAPLGKPKALAIIATARANVVSYRSSSWTLVKIYARGAAPDDKPTKVQCQKTSVIQWFHEGWRHQQGARIAEETLIKMLAESSHRTHIFTAVQAEKVEV